MPYRAWFAHDLFMVFTIGVIQWATAQGETAAFGQLELTPQN